MPADLNRLTPAEAAYVANVTLRDINRAIDEELLSADLYESLEGRLLKAEACPLVEFYFSTASELTSHARTEAMTRIWKRFRSLTGAGTRKAPSVFISGALKSLNCEVRFNSVTVDFYIFFENAAERIADLEAAKEMVVANPETLGGTPVIRGTRIPVYDVAASLAVETPRARIRSAYPALDDRMIDLAAIYAKAVPMRGRPRKVDLPPKGAASRKTVARRRRPRS